MARKHVIKLYALQLRRGLNIDEIPEDMRSEVMELFNTLPSLENSNDVETQVNSENE